MDDQTPLREYPYHYGKEFLGCFTVAVVLLAIGTGFCFYEAATSSQSVVIEKGPGRVELTGKSARLALAVVGAIGLLCLLVCVRAAVNEARKSSRPKQRIAFFDDGIRLPRDMDAEDEGYVEYADISQIEVEAFEHHGTMRHVTFLHFYCSRGKFSIARRKLTATAFAEIEEYLRFKVAQARPASADRIAPVAGKSPLTSHRGKKTCPSCGASLNVYAVKCRDCGASV